MADAETPKQGKQIRLRVLVAEDEPQVADLLCSMLKSLGHSVVAKVNSGSEAIRIVRAEPLDVVIMDLGLPDMDGITATRIILNEQNVALIFCSGMCNAATMESARQLGVHGYLVKPFTRNQLFTTLTLAFSHHARLAEAKQKVQLLDHEISELKLMTTTIELMVDRYKITHEEANKRLNQISERRGCSQIEAARAIHSALQGTMWPAT